MLTELRELDTSFRSLREKIENGDEAFSIARSTAFLYVDFIARVHTFSRQVDIALDGELVLSDRPFWENVKRVTAVMGIYGRLCKIMLEATEGLLKCLGGKEVIAHQAMAGWVARHPEAETTVAALEQLMQRIERIRAK